MKGPPGHETEPWSLPALANTTTSPSVHGDHLPERDWHQVDPWPDKE